MKAYLTTTGTLFALLALVHLWRIVEEPHLRTEPWYILITIAAAALSAWAWRLVRVATRSPS